MSQHMEALARANEVREEAARQRKGLIGAPMQVVAERLTHPTPELGRLKLSRLFIPRCGQSASVIPRVGQKRLQSVFNRLSVGAGRRNWHSELRLGELTQRERDRLIAGLVDEAPTMWREAA
jgi:hypothetical protein